MEFRIEGDGVIRNFYRLVWEKQEKDQGLRGFSLPDTVIYKHQQPRAWYFTTKSGCIKRRLKEKLTANNIEKSFLTSIPKSQIIALYIYSSDKSLEIEYFTISEFKHFLHNRHKPFDGILQKFIDPQGIHNTSIQMIWTSHLCLFEMRSNKNSLYDQRLNIYERVPTIETDGQLSEVKPLKGLELRNYLQEIGEGLVEHFAAVTSNKVRISRMVIIFKLDELNRLWVLMATSIRCTSRVPLEIASAIKLPEMINSKRSTSNTRQPLCVQKQVLCKACDSACEVDRMYDITYQSIIAGSKEKIPKLIAQRHPKLKLHEFEAFKTDSAFMVKTAMVCEDCFLNFLQEPRIKLSLTSRNLSSTPPPSVTRPKPIKLPQKTQSKPSFPGIPTLRFTRSPNLIKS